MSTSPSMKVALKMAPKIWNRPGQFLLSALVAFNLAPLISVVPVWITVMALMLVILKVAQVHLGFELKQKNLVWIVGFLGCLGIAATKHTLVGYDAATALLFLLSGCKLLETDRQRDAMITILLCFFLLTAFLLDSQSLWAGVFLFFDLLFSILIMLQMNPGASLIQSLRMVGRILLITLPMWILFFLFFPRFTVTFWNTSTALAKIGFNDDMNPGNISQLAENDELAFRAKFAVSPARANTLYWRGAILTLTDGLHWWKNRSIYNHLERPLMKNNQETTLHSGLQYQVWLEPQYRRWLFALDYPEVGGSSEGVKAQKFQIRRTEGLIFESFQDLATRVTYTGNSTDVAPAQEMTERERMRYLQLPAYLEPRVQALALQLRDPLGRVDHSLRRLQNWFSKERFVYTLHPDPIPGNSVGGFLFESKSGFCEHFAAAAALLLRVMGAPARVVVGFQGGELNTLGDYWIVKNNNAHAWVEVWSDREHRWMRFDAVAAAAPARVEMGTSVFTEDPSNSSSFATRIFAHSKWFLAVSRTWDAAEMQWIRFLSSYDFQFQQNLFAKVGLENASRATFFGVALVGALLLFGLLNWFLQKRWRSVDEVARLWREFCRQAAQAGVPKEPSEGPLDYKSRLVLRFPEKADRIGRIVDEYITLDYGDSLDVTKRREAIARLKSEVKSRVFATLTLSEPVRSSS